MFTEKAGFCCQINESTVVWRYMDFTKFVSMLDTSSLYFARVDKLGDPFESTMPEGNFPLINRLVQDKLDRIADLSQRTEERLQTCTYLLTDMQAINHCIMFVNCWHESEYESDAMWKLYLKSNEGIAVQTTTQRLSDSFAKWPNDVYIGKVAYIDYKKQSLPWKSLEDANPCDLVLHKRVSFSHEREVRAVTMRFPDVGFNTWKDAHHVSPSGVQVPVDLGFLIKNIYVAPTSPAWFHSLVESVVAKYGLQVKVLQSELAAQPFAWPGL